LVFKFGTSLYSVLEPQDQGLNKAAPNCVLLDIPD